MPVENVAFQGERGAFGAQCADLVYPGVALVPCETFRDVFEAVATGPADAAVVPIENSFAGSINDVYDLLLQYHPVMHIVGEHVLRVRHMLMAIGGQSINDIHTVMSHPQALAQSDDFLRTLHINIEQFYDTAGAAKLVSERHMLGVAAVASTTAAQEYGLHILAENIETSADNVTRFLMLEKEPGHAPVTKTSLIITTENKPGALLAVLELLARDGLNMTKLESRPSKKTPWQYIFYVDIETNCPYEEIGALSADLQERTIDVIKLGSYGLYPTTVSSAVNTSSHLT